MNYTGSAVISECGQYRYILRRQWRHPIGRAPSAAVFIMLNPSTADAKLDDHTIRKCVEFAKRWNLDALKVVNLFGWRSRHPRTLLDPDVDPVGPENDMWIRRSTIYTDTAPVLVAAWGANGSLHRDRVRHVAGLVPKRLQCLGVCASGDPVHPLVLPYTAALRPWSVELIK
jgi:hypothetical protein